MGGFQNSVEVYYVVNILTGFGAAPVDSLVQISTTDLFFAHERGTRLSLFAFALGTGSYMGPVAAGYITESQGWRFCFWYLVIFFGIILLLQIFTQEESIFRRPLPEPEALQELNKDGAVKEGDLLERTPSPSSLSATDETQLLLSQPSQYQRRRTGKGWPQSIPKMPILRSGGGSHYSHFDSLLFQQSCG